MKFVLIIQLLLIFCKVVPIGFFEKQLTSNKVGQNSYKIISQYNVAIHGKITNLTLKFNILCKKHI